MDSNLDRYKNDLEELITLGGRMEMDLNIRAMEEKGNLDEKFNKIKKLVQDSFERDFQRWYTEAHSVIRQIIPERLQEFDTLYQSAGNQKEINSANFSIQDW